MKSHQKITMAYATFVLMLAVVFFKNTPEMKTISWNNQESVRGLSSPEQTETEKVNAQAKAFLEEYAALKKDVEEAKKDKDPEKMNIKELKKFIAELKEKFPLEKFDALYMDFANLQKAESEGKKKVDENKLPTNKEMEALKVANYIIELQDLLVDKATEVAASLEDDAKEKKKMTVEERLAALEKENKRLEQELAEEKCDSYSTLADLRDILDQKLEDKYGVLAEVQRQNSPQDYMSYFMAQMMSQSMNFNPMRNMFGLSYSPFSFELESIQTMQRFGFKAPSIFDYSDQVFRLPGISAFPNVSNDMDLARSLGNNGRYGFGNQNPIIINNNNSAPAYAQPREAQLFPEWNRGDGNVQMFSMGRPQTLNG